MARRGHGRSRWQSRALNCLICHKLQETDIALRIAPIMKEHRDRGFAVSTGTPEFLQIVLNRGRMLPMDDHANIWNV